MRVDLGGWSLFVQVLNGYRIAWSLLIRTTDGTERRWNGSSALGECSGLVRL